MNTTIVKDYLLGLQDRIVAGMEGADGQRFITDAWQREPGGKLEGEGRSRLLEGGNLLERGGCSFSHVKGKTLPPSATQHRPELAGAPFEAMGVSLVFHPRNPYVPTVHMNVRMLAAFPVGAEPVTWFGGGMDLTPYYGFEEDAAHFHRVNRDALAPSAPTNTRAARPCRPRPRSTAPIWPARRSRRWACRSSSIRAIRMCRPST